MDPNVDLLGNNEMPVREPGRGILASLGTLFFYAILALVTGFAYKIARHKLRNMSEEHQKRAVRRKYGIPDSSNEPFNVAYAKAEKKKRREEDKLREEHLHRPARILENQNALQAPSSYQRTPIQTTPQQRAPQISSLYEATAPERSPLSRTWYPDRDDTLYGAPTEEVRLEPESVRQVQPLHDQSLNEYTRYEDKAPDGFDNGAQELSLNSPVEESDFRPPPSPRNVRGAKRGPAPVDEIENIGTFSRKAGKRTRRQSRRLHGFFDEKEEGDRLMDLDPVARGKKRDRAEAGSTFGGDDDSPLSGQGRRKTRRQKRKSDISDILDNSFLTRGTKRNFEVESTLDSEDEGSPRRAKMSRRLETRASDSSDASFDGPIIEAACGDRRIGEEWLANGTTFKVGQDGRRRRQVLLRRRRSRFSMPQDSQHPDSQEQLEVLVETWLNDDEYAAAEERGEVYRPSSDSGSIFDINSSRAGKQLLYGTPSRINSISKATIVTPDSPVPANNPFDHPSSGTTKRISLISDSRTSPMATPSIRNSKSYSKWEKQDLEAEAMAKLRQKLDEEKRSMPTVAKKVAFEIPPSSGTSAAPSGASTPSVIEIVQTPAPSRDETPMAPKSGGFTTAKSDAASNVTPSASAAAASSTSTPSHTKVPTFALTPPQPSKEENAPQLARPSLFGGSPTTSTPSASSEKKEASNPVPAAASPFGSTIAFPSMTTTANTAPKPASPSHFATPTKPDPSLMFKTSSPDGATSTTAPLNPTKPHFAFGKPATAGNQAPNVAFGTSTSPSTTVANSAESTGASSAKPLFSFATAKQASPQASTSDVATAPPAPSSFSPASQQPNINASFGNSTRPSPSDQAKASPFAFGSSGTTSSPFGAAAAGGSSSIFGAGTSGGSKPPPTSTAPTAGGFTFNLGSGSSSTPAEAKATSSTSAAPTSSAFGSSASPFGANSSGFGAAAKAAEGSSSFGTAAKDASKPLFSFNTGAGSTTTSSAAPAMSSNTSGNNPSPFSFNFGASTPNAFSNPTGNSSSSTSSPLSTGTTNGINSAPKPFAFGSSNPGSAFGSSGNSTSPFGASANTAFTFGKK